MFEGLFLLALLFLVWMMATKTRRHGFFAHLITHEGLNAFTVEQFDKEGREGR
jgi:hypothetical protein